MEGFFLFWYVDFPFQRSKSTKGQIQMSIEGRGSGLGKRPTFLYLYSHFPTLSTYEQSHILHYQHCLCSQALYLPIY